MDYLDTIFAVIVARRTDGAVAFDADVEASVVGPFGGLLVHGDPTRRCKAAADFAGAVVSRRGLVIALSIIMRKHHQ